MERKGKKKGRGWRCITGRRGNVVEVDFVFEFIKLEDLDWSQGIKNVWGDKITSPDDGAVA